MKITRKFYEFDSISNLAKNAGLTLTTTVLEVSVQTPSNYICNQLKIPNYSKIFCLKRLRKIDDVPVSIETTYIPYENIYNIERYDFNTLSLYAILKDIYKIEIQHTKEEILIVRSNEQESTLLEIPFGSALTMIKGYTFDQNGNTIEYFENTSLTTLYQFEG